MNRVPHESVEDRFNRLTKQLAVLQAVEREHWERLGFGRRVVPGEPSPAIDEAFQKAIQQAKAAEAELRDASSIALGERDLLTRLQNYTREHLPEHDLSAASVARAHQISVRHLYRLCAEWDISFEQWMIAQRLEATRADLATTEGKRQAVFAVAWRWGFSDPRVFSRRFRRAYGVTPVQWQENPSVMEAAAG